MVKFSDREFNIGSVPARSDKTEGLDGNTIYVEDVSNDLHIQYPVAHNG